MSRRNRAKIRQILPDSRHNSLVVAKFINVLMYDGKRSIAEHIFYRSLEIIKERTGEEGIEIFNKAIENVKPLLEVRSRRIGGASYQVPVEVRVERRQALGIRWLIKAVRAKAGRPMVLRLADEFIDAANNRGAAVKKRDDTHRMAEANRAFAHFKW